jgi:hypothetical protein
MQQRCSRAASTQANHTWMQQRKDVLQQTHLDLLAHFEHSLQNGAASHTSLQVLNLTAGLVHVKRPAQNHQTIKPLRLQTSTVNVWTV